MFWRAEPLEAAAFEAAHYI